MMGYYTAPRIAHGPASIEQLGSLGARRAIVLLDEKVAPTPHARHALEELERAGASVEPVVAGAAAASTAGVDELAARVRTRDADWLVAVGGGTTIDAAKALWARLASPELPLDRLTPLTDLSAGRRLRLAAVPTLPGSGSEASWCAYLAAPDGRVLELSSRELLPEWAIVDPTFLGTVAPSALAAGTAAALARALAAFVSTWSGPLTDAHALPAIAALLHALGRLDRHRDLELDASLLLASTQAGIAAANAPGGLGHALALTLARAFDRPYAPIAAAILPAVVEFDYPSVRDRFGPLVPAFGGSAGTSRSAVSDRLRTAIAAAKAPRSLAEAGVDPRAIEGRREELIASLRRAPGIAAGPRIPTGDELGRLIDAAARGAAVDF